MCDRPVPDVRHQTDVEKSIAEAIRTLANSGNDPRIIEAMTCLSEGLRRISDYVDEELLKKGLTRGELQTTRKVSILEQSMNPMFYPSYP